MGLLLPAPMTSSPVDLVVARVESVVVFPLPRITPKIIGIVLHLPRGHAKPNLAKACVFVLETFFVLALDQESALLHRGRRIRRNGVSNPALCA